MRARRWPAPWAVAFVWAFAEATVWPLMPEAVLVPLALLHPRGWWRITLAAGLGSTLGGAFSYAIGRRWTSRRPVERLPLVRPAMIAAADVWLAWEGSRAVRRQPLSGIPFKVFARRAGSLGVPPAAFLGRALVVRGARFVVASGGTALVAWRFAPLVAGRRWWLILLWSVVFGLGLSRAVATWERRTGSASAPTPLP